MIKYSLSVFGLDVGNVLNPDKVMEESPLAACTPKDYLILDADDEWLCGKDAGTVGWREASEVHPPLSAPPRAPASRARSIIQQGQPAAAGAAGALQEPARRSPHLAGSAEVIACPLVGGGRQSGALTSSCQVAEQGGVDREVEEQHCGCAWSGPPLHSGETPCARTHAERWTAGCRCWLCSPLREVSSLTLSIWWLHRSRQHLRERNSCASGKSWSIKWSERLRVWMKGVRKWLFSVLCHHLRRHDEGKNITFSIPIYVANRPACIGP